MNEDEKSTAAVSCRAVTTDCGKIREREEVGIGGEFRFLNASYQDGLGMEEGGEFFVGIFDAITIEL